jgi:tetratricopeptide (TPR) repeat protein
MKKLIILFCFVAGMQTVLAQTDSIDIKLQTILSEKNDNTRIGKLYDYVLLIQELDPKLNLLFAQKLLVQAQKRNDKLAEAFAYSQIGYQGYTTGNVSKSLEYSLKSLRIAEDLNNAALLAIVNNRLGHTYTIDLNKQSEIYHTAFNESLKTDNFTIQFITCTNIGSAFIRMNVFDSALIYLQRAEQISIKAKKIPFIGNMFSLTGKVYGKLKNQTLATAYFNLAVKEMSQFNSPRFLTGVYTNIASYYNDEGQLDSCTHYAQKAIEVVENTPFTNEVNAPAKLLMDIYRNKNNDLAMKYADMYRIANDSINNLKSIQQNQLLTFEEDLRQQQLAAEKTKAGDERKQNIQYALIALGIIVLLTLYLLLSRSFITNTKLIEFFGVVALLIVFEFLNLLLHPFLERVTHHSPVLMLLALVAIAALLVPLHHKVEKWATAKLVEKNKQIRLVNAKKTIEELENKQIN